MTLPLGAKVALFALSMAGRAFGQSFDTFPVIDGEPHAINNSNQIAGVKDTTAFLRDANGSYTF